MRENKLRIYSWHLLLFMVQLYDILMVFLLRILSCVPVMGLKKCISTIVYQFIVAIVVSEMGRLEVKFHKAA